MTKRGVQTRTGVSSARCQKALQMWLPSVMTFRKGTLTWFTFDNNGAEQRMSVSNEKASDQEKPELDCDNFYLSETAGYGTRLLRDIENDLTGNFKDLRGIAKPLLPVGPCALISLWVQALTKTGCVDAIYVVTNDIYHEAFLQWAQEYPNVKVINDGTTKNENRHGAVACLQLTVKLCDVDDHLLVIGGDTLFKEDFSLGKFTERFLEVQNKDKESNLVLSYQCKDEETSKYGILELDEDLKVQCMKEKPLPNETSSRSACPCFYLLSKTSLPLLDTFLFEKKNAPIEDRDAPGNFLSWLILRRPVYVQKISGRFDVGNLASYIECDKYFKEQLKNPTVYLM